MPNTLGRRPRLRPGHAPLLVLRPRQPRGPGPVVATAGDRVGPPAMGVYLTHMVHRQVEWSIRHHSRRVVDGWLRLAAAILDDVAACTGFRLRSWA